MHAKIAKANRTELNANEELNAHVELYRNEGEQEGRLDVQVADLLTTG